MVATRRKRPIDPAQVVYPALRDILVAYLADGGTQAAIARALGVHHSMAQRYVEGRDMPRKTKIEKLAALVGVTPAELRGEASLERATVPGAALIRMADLTEDEQIILEAYRKLPPHGRQSLRIHATRLLKEFAAGTPTYPFKKHHQ